ncbi:MAG TPA: hypothetical protein VN248_00820 [Arenimonas sp.]|nr:hypothetical protein [Arenimonas sp.]
MFFLLLAAALSQAPAAPVQAAPSVAAAPDAITAPITPADAKEAKKSAKNDAPIGCVARTGSRIRRHDKANCDNGRSISGEDIERAGGQIAPFVAPAIPAAAGN